MSTQTDAPPRFQSLKFYSLNHSEGDDIPRDHLEDKELDKVRPMTATGQWKLRDHTTIDLAIYAPCARFSVVHKFHDGYDTLCSGTVCWDQSFTSREWTNIEATYQRLYDRIKPFADQQSAAARNFIMRNLVADDKILLEPTEPIWAAFVKCPVYGVEDADEFTEIMGEVVALCFTLCDAHAPLPKQ